jgi:hypothetical protein
MNSQKRIQIKALEIQPHGYTAGSPEVSPNFQAIV